MNFASIFRPSALPTTIIRCLRGIACASALLASFGHARADGSEAPAAAYQLPADPAALLRLDDEMVAFFAPRIHRTASLETRLDEIAAAILGPVGLHFRYEIDGVYDVREAFRRRRGNCVTYALLVVALAREYGIPARFNEVSVIPRWSRAGGIVIESRHINVWVAAPVGGYSPSPSAGYEIDLKFLAEQSAVRSGSRVVDDFRAFAGAYGNTGVYRLAAGDRAGGIALLERAVAIDPSFAGAWANLGGANLLVGRAQRAEECYRRALECDPATMPALSGLARIARDAGRRTEAERLERRVQRYREHNPYYLLAVARSELAEGRAFAAKQLLVRALQLKADEPELYKAMVEVSRQLGVSRDVALWTERLGRFHSEIAVLQ